MNKRIGPVTVKGHLHSLSRYADGKTKLVVRVDTMSRVKPRATPDKIRVTLRKSKYVTNLLPGDYIEFSAILFPPPEPTHPGGYDFARRNWFEGIGASGFIIKRPKVLQSPISAPFLDRFSASIEQFRQSISQRLQAQLTGDKGGVAAALIVGDRNAIPRHVIDILRDAGLAHLLAISGLHMALFAGTIFGLFRAMLALNVTLALRYPVKKWAAAGALAGALFYLMLSGATIATQRAFIMITIMFVAIMLDRPAISLRNIAIAALIILGIQPVSLLSISFQMSFAATIALVAFYEWYRRRERSQQFSRPSSNIAQGFYTLAYYLFGIALTSLIASTATSPFAAYYFQRIAVFGLLANVLALPIVAFIVMPAGLIALVLMPLGLEGIALSLMGLGLDIIIDIARWTATLPNAVRVIPSFSSMSLYMIVFGGLWLCLWQTRWRLFGVLGIVAGFSLMPFHETPDVYIAANGKNVAVRNVHGDLVLAKSSREKFAVTKWLEQNGDIATPKQAAKRPGFQCDRNGCIYKLGNDRILAYAETLQAVEEDCQKATILIARLPVHQKCEKPEIVIDWFDLWRNGAYTISFKPGATIVQNAQEMRGSRPWVRARKARRNDKKRK